MFAYCGNNPVNRADATGQFWGELWDGFTSALQESSGYFAVAVGVTQADSPAIGPGDAVGAVMLVGGVLVCAGIAVEEVVSIKAKSSIFDKEKDESLATSTTGSPKPQYYTAEIVNQQVVPLAPLTYQEATIWATSGGNILAVHHKAAFAIVKFFPSARWDGKHGCGKSGYLNHYHLSSAHGNHIWYLGD